MAPTWATAAPDVLVAVPELIALYGPWLLFALAILETCFPLGVVVESGMATAFATVLASRGTLAWESVPLAAVGGGFCGDLIGYGIGRVWGERLRGGTGRWAVLLQRNEHAGRFMGRHPLYAVSLARIVPFARSVMPVSSGIARIAPARYILFEVPGVVIWAALYMGIGLLAGASWERASSLVGGAWTAVFVVAGVLIWRRARHRGELEATPERVQGSGPLAAADGAGDPPASLSEDTC